MLRVQQRFYIFFTSAGAFFIAVPLDSELLHRSGCPIVGMRDKNTDSRLMRTVYPCLSIFGYYINPPLHMLTDYRFAFNICRYKH